jgi:amino acid transporter
MALDSFGIAHTHLAFNDAECVKLPFNPSQPQIFGIFCGLMVLYAVLNSVNIKVMDLMLKGSIFLHVFGSLTIIIGLPIAARAHTKGGLIFGRFQPGNWGASYGHGVNKAQPYSSIYSGYLFNDNVNNGGNGISVTTDTFANNVGASRYGMVSDSSTTTTGTVFNYDGTITATNPTGVPVFPINCNGKTPGHGNTGCIVRSTYHQNFLGESSKNQGTPKSVAMPYIFFCGMLMAQWSFTGYDSCVHMVEETHNAQMSGPAGIMRSLTINALFGLALILSIIGSIQDYRNTYFGPLALNWNPVAQIMWDIFETRTGNGRNACGFWGIIMTIMSACGMSCLTSNARMCYAFSRDGAVPGHQYWHTIDKKTGIPLNAIWFMTFCAIAIAVPVNYSQTAYAAVTSITTIGLYISYATPMFFRVLNRKDFVPGPWYLGDRLSLAIHTGACIWVATICVIFVLPNTYPINMRLNFNVRAALCVRPAGSSRPPPN